MKHFVFVILVALLSGCVSSKSYQEIARAHVDRSFSCLVGETAISFASSTSMKSDTNKKKYDVIGFVTNFTVKAMKDKSLERVIYFSEKTDNELLSYGQMKLTFNDEVMSDGWMHGNYTVIGIYFPEVPHYQAFNINGTARCVYLSGKTEEALLKIASQIESRNPKQGDTK